MGKHLKFKVGSRVKYISKTWGDTNNNPLWGGKHGKVVGTIMEINPSFYNNRAGEDFDYYVKWDSGGRAYYAESDLSLSDEQLKLF